MSDEEVRQAIRALTIGSLESNQIRAILRAAFAAAGSQLGDHLDLLEASELKRLALAAVERLPEATRVVGRTTVLGEQIMEVREVQAIRVHQCPRCEACADLQDQIAMGFPAEPPPMPPFEATLEGAQAYAREALGDSEPLSDEEAEELLARVQRRLGNESQEEPGT